MQPNPLTPQRMHWSGSSGCHDSQGRRESRFRSEPVLIYTKASFVEGLAGWVECLMDWQIKNAQVTSTPFYGKDTPGKVDQPDRRSWKEELALFRADRRVNTVGQTESART